MKKKKYLFVSFGVLGCAIIALSVLYLSEINKYKMSDNELEQYENSIKEYQSIIDEISACSDNFYKQNDSQLNNSSEYVTNIIKLYAKFTQIQFPKKYNALYNELSYAKCGYGISNDLAYITFDPIIDKNVGDYFPPNQIQNYIKKLEKQLYNINNVPKNNSTIDFQQIYFKITQEYYEDNKNISEVYDELHEIFYNKDFLQKIN